MDVTSTPYSRVMWLAMELWGKAVAHSGPTACPKCIDPCSSLGESVTQELTNAL